MSIKQDLEDLRRFAESHGWTVERTGGGHYKWTPPNGGKVAFSPTTPSDYRGVRNLRAKLRQRGLPREDGLMGQEQEQAEEPQAPQPKGRQGTRVTPEQKAILLTLLNGPVADSSGRATPVLAELAGLESKTATGVVRTLVGKGYVETDKNSKRTFRIALTPDGYGKAATFSDSVQTAVQGASPDTGRIAGTDEALVAELLARLHERQQVSTHEKLDLIGGIVKEAENGEISPLKALADIGEAVRL